MIAMWTLGGLGKEFRQNHAEEAEGDPDRRERGNRPVSATRGPRKANR